MGFIAFLLMLWVICVLFPGGGGGYGPSLGDIFANVMAGVIGLTLFGGVLVGIAWCVHEFGLWLQIRPGSNLAGGWVIALFIVPILGLGVFVRGLAAIIEWAEGRKVQHG